MNPWDLIAKYELQIDEICDRGLYAWIVSGDPGHYRPVLEKTEWDGTPDTMVALQRSDFEHLETSFTFAPSGQEPPPFCVGEPTKDDLRVVLLINGDVRLMRGPRGRMLPVTE